MPIQKRVLESKDKFIIIKRVQETKALKEQCNFRSSGGN